MSLEGVFGQSWKNISWDEYSKRMGEVSAQYEADTYTQEITYKTYKGKQLQTPFEVTPSFTQRSKSYDYTYLKGIVTIQNEQMKVTIDSNNRMIAINNGVPRLDQSEALEQYTQNQEYITNIREKESREGLTIELIYKKNMPIEKVQVGIDRKGMLRELVVFYAQPKEYLDENGDLKSDFVILKVEYGSFSKKHLHEELSLNEVIVKGKEGLKLSSAFKEFELIDLRLKN